MRSTGPIGCGGAASARRPSGPIEYVETWAGLGPPAAKRGAVVTSSAGDGTGRGVGAGVVGAAGPPSGDAHAARAASAAARIGFVGAVIGSPGAMQGRRHSRERAEARGFVSAPRRSRSLATRAR